MNWAEILEKVRKSDDKGWLAVYMPELCTEESLADPTKLRVLGNAVANNKANREYMLKSGFAQNLIKPDALCLSVLLNFCIDFPPGAHEIFITYGDKLKDALIATRDEARASAKHLTGGLAQELDITTVPIDYRRNLVFQGFIELILVDQDLEQDPEVLANFPTVYNYALELDDFNDAVQVVGNITCHPTFTLISADVEPAISPVFFIVLANLTGKLAEVPAVMSRFPDALSLVLDYINSDDFEHDEYNSCAHFLRNVGRVDKYAREIAGNEGVVDMVLDLLESPYANVGIQLLGTVGQHVARYDWFEILGHAKPDPSINAVLLTSYSQLCIPLGTSPPEDPHVLDEAVVKIIELLEATPALEQTVNLWLKGSKALALLSRNTKVPNVDHLRQSAPRIDSLQENFRQIVIS